jgi:hypothetical protein
MYSSNSVFFTRNSQLLKQAQTSGAPYYVDVNGNRTATPSITEWGGNRYYYMSDGYMYSEKTKQKVEFNQNIADAVKQREQTEKTQSTTQQPQQAPAQKSQLDSVNERRKQLGLSPYMSPQEMVIGERKAKIEYDKAMAAYAKKHGMDQSEFKNIFPDPTSWEAGQRFSGKKENFTDAEILEAITNFDQAKLDQVERSEVARVLREFITRIPSYNARRGQSWEEYVAWLEDTELPQHAIRDPRMIKYIINQKMRAYHASMKGGMASAARERGSFNASIREQPPRQPQVRPFNQ